MGDNRFDFLEFGDDLKAQASALPDFREITPEQASDAIQTPPESRDPGILDDGTALAEVRVTDTRGYSGMQETQERDERFLAYANPVNVEATRALRVVEVLGGPGRSVGQFQFPTGLAVDASGILFIADSYNHRIQRITPNGGVSIIGSRGAGRGQFLSPQAVATDARRAFYIVEQGNHRIQKYSTDGVLELIFGRLGQRYGEFSGPTTIAVAAGTGDIYVADTGNSRVQRFDANGQFLSCLGMPGTSAHTLSSPQALAVDAADNLYVADTLTHRIVRYDPMGRFVTNYFSARSLDPESTLRPFHEPRALATDHRGLLYIADNALGGSSARPTQGRILAMDSDHGRALASLTDVGRGLGPVMRPCGIAVGLPSDTRHSIPRGDVFVSDTMNHRILRFAWS